TRAHGDDQILGGAANETGVTAPDPDDNDERADPGFPGEVQARMAVRLPAVATARLARAEAGLYDMSPDTRAILDRVPGVDGLYLAAGFSGTGFKKAPAVGLGLAELVTAGRATSIDLEPFRYGRFAEGAPIHGADEYV